MILALLAAPVALADPVASPPFSGFRTEVPGVGESVGTRLAFVEDPDGPWIIEDTLRVAGARGHWWGAVEVAGTGGASDLWTGAGLGNVGLEGGGRFGTEVPWALGVRGVLPLGGLVSGAIPIATNAPVSAAGPVSWWGTVPSATVPEEAIAVEAEGAIGRTLWRVETGYQSPAWAGNRGAGPLVDVDVSLATVQPLVPGWWLVVEGEVLNQPGAVYTRALVRADVGRGWTADAGVDLPLLAIIQDPSLHLVAAVRRRWGRSVEAARTSGVAPR